MTIAAFKIIFLRILLFDTEKSEKLLPNVFWTWVFCKVLCVILCGTGGSVLPEGV